MNERVFNWIATIGVVLALFGACVGLAVFWGWALESHDLTTVMCLISGAVAGHLASRVVIAIWS